MREFVRKNIKNVIAFDIETVSTYKDIEKENPELLEMFRYKKREKETEELPTIEEAVRLYNKEGATNPIYGKIVSVSFSYMKGGKPESLVIGSHDEREVLLKANEVLKSNFSNTSANFQLVGYNSSRFDIPFMRMRSDILGIDFPNILSDSGKKPWEVGGGVHFDLMTLFKGSMWFVPSFEEFCVVLGVPTPKSDIRGSEVSLVYHNTEDGLERIKEYNKKDTEALLLALEKFKS